MDQKIIKKNRTHLFLIFTNLSIKNFFFSPINVFLGLILTLWIMLMWLFFKSDDPFVVISAIGAAIIRNGLYAPIRIFNKNKETNFFGKLRNTPVNESMLILAMIFSSFITNLIVTILLFSFAMMFQEQRSYIPDVNFYIVISALILLWMLSLVIAYFIFIFFPNKNANISISLLIYVLSYNFLGLAFPYYIIANYQWLNILLYLLPHRYMINTLQAGWVNRMDLKYVSENYSVDWQLGGHMYIPYLVTILLIIATSITIIFIKYISWNTKKKHSILSSNLNIEEITYIRAINNAKNIEEVNLIRKNFKQKIR